MRSTVEVFGFSLRRERYRTEPLRVACGTAHQRPASCHLGRARSGSFSEDPANADRRWAVAFALESAIGAARRVELCGYVGSPRLLTGWGAQALE